MTVGLPFSIRSNIVVTLLCEIQKSRGLAAYNNEFIPWYSAGVDSENHWDQKLSKIGRVLRSNVDELKWCINSEWAALSHAVI